MDIGWPLEPYLVRRLRGLALRGLRVTITARSDVGDTAELEGIDVLRLPRPGEPRAILLLGVVRDGLRLLVRDRRRLGKLVAAARAAYEWDRALRRLRVCLPLALAAPDVIHFEWETSALRLMPLLEALGAPVVVGGHGNIHLRPPSGDEELKSGYPPLFATVAAVHCVSEAVRVESLRYGLDPRKAWVIRTGVDVDYFSPGQRSSSNVLRVLSVGGLVFFKGHEDALDAIAILVAKGVPVSYEILGGGPSAVSRWADERPRLLYLIQELGLSEHVRLAGEVSQAGVRDRLREADVLLHPSLSEGLPNAVLEAMACELPVVVTDAGGVTEAITDGVEGLVCARRSPEELAAALIALWQDPSLRRRLGEAGRARVCVEFALADQLDRFVEFYDELARRHS